MSRCGVRVLLLLLAAGACGGDTRPSMVAEQQATDVVDDADEAAVSILRSREGVQEAAVTFETPEELGAQEDDEARLDALRAASVRESDARRANGAAAKRQMVTGFTNRTLERVRGLHQSMSQGAARVSTHLAVGLTNLVGSPVNCTVRRAAGNDTTAEVGGTQQRTPAQEEASVLNAIMASNPNLRATQGHNSTATSYYGDRKFVQYDHEKGGAQVNELGDDLTDIAFASDAPLSSLCNEANVPQLPVLVKWLVGLDSHAAVQPRLLGTIRNVLLAALLAVAVMCAGYCVGSRVHRQPLELPLTYARAPPSVFSLGDQQNRGNHGYAMGPRFGGGHSMMDSAMQRSTQPLHSFKLRSKATKSSRE